MTLVEFLKARLDEDELVALDASPGPWSPNAEADEVVAEDGITVCDGFALSGNQLRATVQHITRYDPARVLREVAAKRLALEEVTYWEGRVEAGAVYADRPANRVQQLADDAQGVAHRFEATQAILRALATAYADHSEYRSEWAV